jgi:glutathione-independent formaldehyde dehydrogenase
MRYHHGLMQMILHDKAQIAKAVERDRHQPRRGAAGLQGLRQRVAKKFILNPHGLIKT